MAIGSLTLLFDLGLILIAATLFNFLAKLLRQPPLLAYIAAGLFVGPLFLGAMHLSALGVPIGVTTSEEIMLLSELGVAFLLFSIGIETDLRKLLEFGKLATIGTALQISLTALVVFALNSFLKILNFEQSLYLGLILAFSSTTIVVKLLSDSRQINTLHGRIMIGFLLMQDILAILCLSLLQNIGSLFSFSSIAPLFLQVVAILAIAFALNRFIYPKLFSFATQSEELLFLSAMSSVFVFIFLSYAMGLSISVGAFIGGVALSTLPYSMEVLQKVRGVRDFLATIFFVTLGIQITPTFMSFPAGLALAILAIVFVFKPLIIYAITLLAGYGGRVSLSVALALAQVSEFSFILASQGSAILQATPGLYSFLILVIALSMAMTPYLVNYTPAIYANLDRLVCRYAKPLKNAKILHRSLNLLESLPAQLNDHVIIFGGGTVGQSIAATIREESQVVVIDCDPKVVSYNIEHGTNTLYGSVDNPELWKKLNMERSKAIILAVPFAKPCLSLIKYVKKSRPQLVVFARAHYFHDALALYEAGADYVVMPQVVGSNLFVRKVMQYMQTGNIEEISNYKPEFMQYLREKVSDEEKLRRF